MSEVGKISGQMLEDNLERSGVDLSFDSDLLYLDVTNRRIGANSTTPYSAFLVNNTLKTDNLIIDTQFNIADLTFYGNTIQNVTGPIYLDSFQNTVFSKAWATTGGLKINSNNILTTNTDQNINFNPTGTGKTNFYSNVYVNGSLHATGDITFDGNLTFGDSDTDSVNIKADIASDIRPDVTETYSLGSISPTAKRWNNTWATNTQLDSYVSSGAVVANNIDLTLAQGKTWYVATNGTDTNVGYHQSGPFASLTKALSVATSGDTIMVSPGTYQETCPMTVPVGVTVRGLDIRTVIIAPTVATRNKDIFLLNGETTLEDLTVTGFEYDSVNNTGYAFRFKTGMTVSSRSPYIKNISVITQGSSVRLGTAPADDPRGYLAGDAGRGAYIDGSVVNSASKEASMLFHSCTFICPGARTIYMTNGVRVEWLNCFTYFAETGLYAYNGFLGFASLGYFNLTVANVLSHTINPGDTITVNLSTTGTRTFTISEVNYSGNNAILKVTGDSSNIQTYSSLPSQTFNITNGSQVFTSPQYDLRVTKLGGKYADGNTFNDAIWNNQVPVGSRVIVKWLNQTSEIDMGIVTQVQKGGYSFSDHYVYVTNPSNFAMININGSPLVDDKASYFRIETVAVTFSGGQSGSYVSSVSAQFGKFGAELRSINSASIYGRYGAWADGPNTLMYLIGHNFAYVGAGRYSNNDPTLVIDGNEAIMDNSGKIYYQSTDQSGNVRVGSVFKINGETGAVSFVSNSLTLGGTSSISFQNGSFSTYIDPQEVTTGNITFSGNTIKSLTGNIVFTPSSGKIIFQANSLGLPIATDAQLTLSTPGEIKFNPTSTSFEGYWNNGLLNLYAIGDSTRTTRLVPESTPGANDQIIKAYANGDLKFTADTTKVYFKSLDLGGLSFNKFPSYDGRLTLNGNTDLTITPTSDITNIKNLAFSTDSITDTTLDSVLTLNSTNTGYWKIGGQAITVPLGNNASRPAVVEVGMQRYNTELAYLEAWDGTAWVNASGSTSVTITDMEEISDFWALVVG